MNLMAGIHARWAADPDLVTAIPADRLVTGIYQADEPTLPYCTLERTHGKPSYTNNGASVDTVPVRFTVHDHDHARGTTILAEVKRLFDRQDFELEAGEKVINMQRTADSEAQDEDGVWLIRIEFRCLVYLPAGA